MSDRVIQWTVLGSLACLLAALCAVAFGPDLWFRWRRRLSRRPGFVGDRWRR